MKDQDMPSSSHARAFRFAHDRSHALPGRALPAEEVRGATGFREIPGLNTGDAPSALPPFLNEDPDFAGPSVLVRFVTGGEMRYHFHTAGDAYAYARRKAAFHSVARIEFEDGKTGASRPLWDLSWDPVAQAEGLGLDPSM